VAVSNVDIEVHGRTVSSFYAAPEVSSIPWCSLRRSMKAADLPLWHPSFSARPAALFPSPVSEMRSTPATLQRYAALIHPGLQPYSSSLKRYLWVSPVVVQNVSGFYVYERDHLDPPGVKDRFALIRELGLLASRPDAVDLLPCGACVAKQECFGQAGWPLRESCPFLSIRFTC